jgi:ElaB/YqjD/DUF883 family membrane-anchored ribosome-binding protein
MSDVLGKVESAAQAEVAQLANVALSKVETAAKAEVGQLVPVAQTFVAAHDLWFVGGAFGLGLVIGLIL